LVPDVQQVNADLSISIAAPSQAASGTQMAYTITINNAGPGTATGVTVNAPTPAGTTFSSVSATGAKVTPPAPGTTGTITAAFGSLAPGGVGRFLVTVNVLAASGTSLSATATVTGTSTDPNTANNTATQIIPVQGGGIVFLSWTRPVPTAANPIPPPGNLTASAGIPQPNTELLTAESVVEPSDTVSCPGGFIVGYNIYIASTASVAIVPANLWVAMVPPDQLNAKVASRPGGTFYAMTTLWNCGGMIVESGSSNTASTCQGPEIRQVKVSGKIKIFGSSFTDPATGPVSSVFVDGFPYNKAPIFLDSTFLKQKGTIDVNGTQMNVLDYMVGKTSIVITVQVQSTQGSQQNTCISSISFPPGP
jgi:uncharacterized repeat protein (TIGR01451 family)